MNQESTHHSLTWKASDGQELFGQYWKTPNEEKALIALVHGFGEHSGRYDHVAEAFNRRGYSVLAFDHRGHGKSGGQRGHTPTYEQLLKDVDALLEKAADLFPDVPVIIYGHSMGGNIVTNYLISRKPNLPGAVVTGPFFRTTEPPPAFQLALGKVMDRIWGAFPDRAKLDAANISRDKAVVDRYVNDPMVHNRISARMGLALIDRGEYAIDQADRVEIPFLIVHGGSDKLTDPQGSRDFMKKAGSNVTLKILDGFYHEVHNDPGKEGVIDTIIDWCDKLVGE